MNERDEINVVNDQLGSPTNAKDLAEAILCLIVNRETGNKKQETRNSIFHFTNSGITSWYDFAVAIRDIKNLTCKINPIPTALYPTPAKRPAYSVMKKEKIISVLGIELKDWKKSLGECINSI